MYLIILELMGKWEEALQVIEGPLSGSVCTLVIVLWHYRVSRYRFKSQYRL